MSRTVLRYLADISRRVRTRWAQITEHGFLGEREARGLALLREWLSPEQLAQYDKHRHFDVTGCHSGKRYRIRHGTEMNVYEVDSTGRPLAGWCFVPRDHLVAGDVMLAQKIALETSEFTALTVAKGFLPRWHL